MFISYTILVWFQCQFYQLQKMSWEVFPVLEFLRRIWVNLILWIFGGIPHERNFFSFPIPVSVSLFLCVYVRVCVCWNRYTDSSLIYLIAIGRVTFFLLSYKNKIFIEIFFICCKTHPFKVYNLVGISLFTLSCIAITTI